MPIMKEKYSVSQSILYKTNSHLRIIIHTINCIAKDVHTVQIKRESYLLNKTDSAFLFLIYLIKQP